MSPPRNFAGNEIVELRLEVQELRLAITAQSEVTKELIELWNGLRSLARIAKWASAVTPAAIALWYFVRHFFDKKF